MTTAYTTEQLIAAGGSAWKSPDGKLHRVYFQIDKLIGLEVEHYKTGNVSSATLNGESISNTLASEWLSLCRASKAWIDVATGEAYAKIGYSRRAKLSGDDVLTALGAAIAKATA